METMIKETDFTERGTILTSDGGGRGPKICEKITQEQSKYAEWIHAESGYRCEITRPLHPTFSFFYCGYVHLPPDHPWYTVNYNDIDQDIQVHGGQTYSIATAIAGTSAAAGDTDNDVDEERRVGLIDNAYFDDIANVLNFMPKLDVGIGTYKDFEWVVAETNKMAHHFYIIAKEHHRQ